MRRRHVLSSMEFPFNAPFRQSNPLFLVLAVSSASFSINCMDKGWASRGKKAQNMPSPHRIVSEKMILLIFMMAEDQKNDLLGDDSVRRRHILIFSLFLCHSLDYVSVFFSGFHGVASHFLVCITGLFNCKN